MENQKPTLLYFFAHVFLRDALFQQWETFRPSIQKGPEIFQENLRANFLRLQDDRNNFRNTSMELSADDFKPLAVTVGSGDTKIRMFVIRFPKPMESPEVAYVAFTDEAQPRYFTVELSRPTSSQKDLLPENLHGDKYIFCEWTSDGMHHNFGSISSPILENTIKQIDNVLKSN